LRLQNFTKNVEFTVLFLSTLKKITMNLNSISDLKANRRVFMMQTVLTTAGIVAAASAQAQALVAENDPQASALGYKADATKVDKAKFPKYAAGQNCANCALFQGAAGAAAGGCPLYAGKQVSAKAWCSAYNKKG
jgi:hypothetical protein